MVLKRNAWRWAGWVVVLAGCSGSPPRVAPPELSTNAGADAVRAHDANGDGVLDAGEVNRAPELRAASKTFDRNGDGKITAEEIDSRVAAWRDSGLGLASCVVRVQLNGKPLEEADVIFKPASFLGEALRPAEGKTNRRGTAVMRVAGMDRSGTQVGLYRVEISKMVDGKETIPARYNAQSELGLEVAGDLFDSAMPFFNLRGG